MSIMAPVSLPKLCVLLLITIATCMEATQFQLQNLKETNIVFYMHDWETGLNATAVPLVGIKRPSVLEYGTVAVIDDKLTVAYDRNSTEIGRARGIYVNSALDGSELHFLLSLVFTNKEFNGSTLEIQGSNRFFQKFREVSVVSGTGKFRLARGFAILETVFLDLPNLNAILRWNTTVFHF